MKLEKLRILIFAFLLTPMISIGQETPTGLADDELIIIEIGSYDKDSCTDEYGDPEFFLRFSLDGVSSENIKHLKDSNVTSMDKNTKSANQRIILSGKDLNRLTQKMKRSLFGFNLRVDLMESDLVTSTSLVGKTIYFKYLNKNAEEEVVKDRYGSYYSQIPPTYASAKFTIRKITKKEFEAEKENVIQGTTDIRMSKEKAIQIVDKTIEILNNNPEVLENIDWKHDRIINLAQRISGKEIESKLKSEEVKETKSE